MARGVQSGIPVTVDNGGVGSTGVAATYALLVLVTVVWGATVPVLSRINTLRAGTPLVAWDIVWLRLVPATLLFAPLLLARRRALRDELRGRWTALFAVGLLTTTAYNFFLIAGEERVPPSVASLMIGLNPTATLLLSAWLLGDRVGWRGAAGLFISLAGLAWVTGAGGGGGAVVHGSAHETAGATGYGWTHLALTAGAPLAFSVGSVITKRTLGHLPAATVTGATVAAGSFPLWAWPWMGMGSGLFTAAPGLPAEFWLWIAFLVLGPLMFGYYVWYVAIERLDAGRVSSFIFLVPIFGVLLSWAGGEPARLSTALGGLAVMAGVVVTNWKVAPRR